MWWRMILLLWLCIGGAWVSGGCEPIQPAEPVQESIQSEGQVQDEPQAREQPPEPRIDEPVVEARAADQSEPLVDATEPAVVQESASEPVAEPATEPAAEPINDEPPGVEIADAGPEHPDAAAEMPPENPVPLTGFGSISGDCGVLDDTEWKSSQSFLFRNAIDLGTVAFDETKLTPGGQKIWKDGNLGGSSVHSEIFAYELLQRCELGILLKSEAEIKYKQSGGKKTDLLVEIDGRKVGVSVTRAFHFPPTNPYTEAEAKTLLTKKLGDIPLSAANADAQDAWVRSILFILAYDKQYADVVEAAYKNLDAQLKSNIILIVAVTDGKDDYIY